MSLRGMRRMRLAFVRQRYERWCHRWHWFKSVKLRAYLGHWSSAIVFTRFHSGHSHSKSIKFLKCGAGETDLVNLLQTDDRQLNAPVKKGREEKCATLEGHSQTCNLPIIELSERKERHKPTYWRCKWASKGVIPHQKCSATRVGPQSRTAKDMDNRMT